MHEALSPRGKRNEVEARQKLLIRFELKRFHHPTIFHRISTATKDPAFLLGRREQRCFRSMLCKNPSSVGSIWVCGEVLIDRIPSPVIGDEGRVNVVGGGAANTAKCISRLGYDVQFIDGLSADSYGTISKNELLEDGVGLDLCLQNSDKPTCLATVSLDENKKASYEFLIDGTATFDFELITVEHLIN